MSDGQQDTILEPRVALPEPDVSNITVLTESLPNEPVLPWHHFDSPWLEREAEVAPEVEVAPVPTAEAEPAEQLTLELELLIATVEELPTPNDLPEESAA
jgi:hypothetical protein